jgi:caffeoyl-CoA O-methyltransferase
MPVLSSDALSDYVHAHTSEPHPAFAALVEETRSTLELPQMQVGRVEGAFLRMLVQISGARRILEIGTYSGYSSMALASGLPEGGELITCDIDPVATEVARRHMDASPWGEKIEIRLAPAIETIESLAAGGARFDLVFIDADKPAYISYWNAVLPLVPSGGLILADNTLWSGSVLAPNDEEGAALDAFNRHVKADDRVEHVLLSVRDGVMLCRKR